MPEAIDISIVVPVYNSEHSIIMLVDKITEALETSGLVYEIILVDDYSNDLSWKRINELPHTTVKGIGLSANCGQWYASMQGIKLAQGSYIVTIDDDLEYSPADILLLYKYIISSAYDVIFGISPEKYTVQGKNKTMSVCRNWLLNKFWNKGPTDSFKIFKKEILSNSKNPIPDIHFEAYITQTLPINKWGYVNVGYHKRHAGKSNYYLSKKIKLLYILNSHYGINWTLVSINVLLYLFVVFTFYFQKINMLWGLVFCVPLFLYFLLKSTKPIAPKHIRLSVSQHAGVND